MALTLESAARLLDRHGLLREIIRGDVWTLDPHDIKGFDEPFSAITYDTRKDTTEAHWRHRFMDALPHLVDGRIERRRSSYFIDEHGIRR